MSAYVPTPATPPLQVLLVGASGFVGSAILREIAARPAGSVRVRALLRTPDRVPDYPFLEKVQGSLARLPSDLAPPGPFVLVHFGVKQLDRDGRGYLTTNVDGTAALLEAAGPRTMGVIYGSSMSVYGQGVQDGVTESAVPRPTTALSSSRLFAEWEIASFARRRGASAYLLRPRFVVGEGDAFVVPSLVKLLARRIRLASGAQRFSIIDVADYARVVVRLAERAAERHTEGTPVEKRLNVGYAEALSFGAIARILRETHGLPAPRIKVPVSLTLTRALHHVPLAAVEQLATRLELVGLSHWGDVRALAGEIGRELLQKDPADMFARAARAHADATSSQLAHRLLAPAGP